MSGSSDVIAVRFLVLGIALEAMQGVVDRLVVGRVAIAVSEVCGIDDPFAREVRRFAHRLDLIRRDPEVLSAAGGELMKSVMRSCWPDPSPRSDLEG